MAPNWQDDKNQLQALPIYGGTPLESLVLMHGLTIADWLDKAMAVVG